MCTLATQMPTIYSATNTCDTSESPSSKADVTTLEQVFIKNDFTPQNQTIKTRNTNSSSKATIKS